jgi:hypothetical protein
MSARRAIAVVLDGPPAPAWQARALEGLRASGAAEVVEVRLTGASTRSVARSLRDALERHVFPVGADPLAPVEVAFERQSSTPAGLVVWLAERPPPREEAGELLWIRHGGTLGSLEDAFTCALRSGSSCVESEVLLRIAGTTVVVERTVSAVRPFSETLSRTLALWKLAAMVPQAVARLPGRAAAASESSLSPRAPAGGELLLRAAASSLRASAIRLLYRRPWSIRVRERAANPARGWGEEEGLVRWAAGHMYADPFLFEHEGRHHLFCEEVERGASRGVISHTELRLDGVAAAAPKRVLSEAHHLSYPFVFAHEGEVFMVPETSSVRRVDLYRAIAFPHRWEREAVLLEDVHASDATLLEHDGHLWMFVSIAPPEASSLSELHLFWAQALRGPWHAHAHNPVVSDVRCGRAAGPIQRWATRLIRPAQDGSRRYGWAISFREIDVLTRSDYAEHEIDRIEPGEIPGARATHAYTADHRFEAIDLRRRQLRLRDRQR